MDDFEHLCHPRRAPASTEVYQRVRQHMRHLKEFRTWIGVHEDWMKRHNDIRDKIMQDKQGSSIAQLLSSTRRDGAVQQPSPVLVAQCWFLAVVVNQADLLNREQEMRMFRAAIEKERAGQKEKWTDMEKLYMALTDPGTPDFNDKMKAGFEVTFNLKLADKFNDISKMAVERTEARQRLRTLDADQVDIHGRFVEKIHASTIDHFACATPLAWLPTQVDVVDDNEGCCPICQNSYTDLSTNTVEDLLADYPVTIKYCGHTIGKSCLEQWMITPKVDEAKFPHRTCPLCRAKIEGVRIPSVPAALESHLKNNRRAIDTLFELVYGWGMEVNESVDAIMACMSEDIAIDEVMKLVQENKDEGDLSRYEKDMQVLRTKKEEINVLMKIWGFMGEASWKPLRNEWQLKRETAKQQEVRPRMVVDYGDRLHV